MNGIAVAVLADDSITREGAIARLSKYHRIAVLDKVQQHRAQVLLVIATEVDDDLLSQIERAYQQAINGHLDVVLVVADLPERYVLRAICSGLVSVLPLHDVDFDRIASALFAAHIGLAELPNVTQRYLVKQLKRIQQEVLAPLDQTVTGLAMREVEVLKLFSDGLDTGEVAAKLNCADRTVKYVVRAVLTRFKLRNRTHAVAYAIRSGAL